jgi:hypothetical protein
MEKTVTTTELNSLYKKYKGVHGQLLESESTCVANRWDIKDGYVTVWSDNSTISKIIKRSSKYILRTEDTKNAFGCKLWIDPAAFRGMEYLFKLNK